jgi:hypothetical protein
MVVAIQEDVATGAVGVTFKNDVSIRRDAKKLAELSQETHQ